MIPGGQPGYRARVDDISTTSSSEVTKPGLSLHSDLTVHHDPATDQPALRRLVLAISVLQNIDLAPGESGVTTQSGRLIPWAAIHAALAGRDPESPGARPVLASWLRSLTSVSWRSPEDLQALARPVGLPRGHVLHPGAGWARATVHGGAVDLGIGLLGIDGDPDVVTVPRPGALLACGIDESAWWVDCSRYLDAMGQLAAERYRRDPTAPLRPMGDCDVPTLLGSRGFRRALIESVHGGMRAAAVPTRNRGWLDLSRTDPAFALVAASLADDFERGFARPLLITIDEVALAREGGDPVLQALRDASAPSTRTMLYR